jgi:hypothetical protein
MIIYLVGKITGNPEYRKQFAAAKAELEAEGHIVLNPAELPEGMSKAAYMRICFAMIDTADELRVIRGWERSSGATLEVAYCIYIGKPVRNVYGQRVGVGVE